MTIDELKEKGLILFECISGSRAYNLHTPKSDTDIKGVFILPRTHYFSLDYIPQVSNPTNDIVYYEIGRFIELLCKSNPTTLELLYTPEHKVLYQDEVFKLLHEESIFLSKQCKNTFAGYAASQIKKARGLNKKIVNPMGKTKKNILAFCYVLYGQGSISLSKWLEINRLNQSYCGLIKINHMKDVYGLYYDEEQKGIFNGLLKKENATEVLLSSVPKGKQPLTHLYFNKDGYTKYCKDYKDYWSWVELRNEERYKNTIEQSKNYDAKNMMHTFRLLEMAMEILGEGKVIVERKDREELLNIKHGKYDYAELIEKARHKLSTIESLYQISTLQEKPDLTRAKIILLKIRNIKYLVN